MGKTNDDDNAVELGDFVFDSVSGFRGTAVQRVEYLHGATRIGVQAEVMEDNKLQPVEYFDESQLVATRRAATAA